MLEARSYFEKRIVDELGITDELNIIKLWNEYEGRKSTFEAEIFSPDDKGNIRILLYNLDRQVITYDHPGATPAKPNINNNRPQTFYVTRLCEPVTYTDKEGETQVKKYDIPKGAGTYPFITPGIIDKFEKKEKITTLVLTEGYFKAFKGFIHGLDIIGLSSITHYKQRDTGKMYFDVIRVIKECKVENIIILYDGDCLNFSSTALAKERDLYTRPAGFYGSISTIYELLKDYINDLNINLYFSHVLSDCLPEKPKGLDDLLIAVKKDIPEVISDLLQFSKPGHYFYKANITTGTARLAKYFAFNHVNNFYELHGWAIKDRKFVFRGTQYQWNSSTSECDVIIPSDAKNYFRVGDFYYEFVHIPNKYRQLEKTFHRRLKSTILDDHKASPNFLRHIPKYKAFCNIPDHVNYVQVQNNCFNVYGEFEHEPDNDGNCRTILFFLRHIYGKQYRLGIDYLQLLYQKPTQILPIKCLVSRENNTGKTTYIKFLKAMFTSNCTVIGNEELNSAFNASYSNKLIIACEESFIEKKGSIEKIKNLSTADKIMMNAKGKDQVEIDFFGKFILASNNEDDFIYASNYDIRYWVINVPKPKEDNVNLLNQMIEEIPAFLAYLNRRKLSTTCQSRMWFHPEKIRTSALLKLIENSKPRIEKEITAKIRDLFFNFRDPEIMLTTQVINKEFFNNRYEESYLSKIIREKFNVDYYRNSEGRAIAKQYLIPRWQWNDLEQKYEQTYEKKIGRPFVFKIEQFLTPKEIEDIQHLPETIAQQERANELPFTDEF